MKLTLATLKSAVWRAFAGPVEDDTEFAEGDRVVVSLELYRQRSEAHGVVVRHIAPAGHRIIDEYRVRTDAGEEVAVFPSQMRREELPSPEPEALWAGKGT
jgi:hypothetical protein